MERVIEFAVLAALALFTARRLLFAFACTWASAPAQPMRRMSVAVCVAAKDERRGLPGLLECLSRLDYPEDRLIFMLVSDGSTDETPRIFEQWAAGRTNARVLLLKESLGKAAALNHALAAAPAAELIAVYDADQRPEPQSLALLAGAFEDERTGAAGGYRRPLNAAATIVSRYAALECWTHQRVTLRGKDRLGISTTTLGGNCVYRRTALDQVNGFRPGAFSEDIEVSLAISARGWRIRFVEQAAAGTLVAATLRAFLRQRRRWTVGLYSSSRNASGIEAWSVALGYADRLVLLALIALIVLTHLSPWWLAIYVFPPAAALALALARTPEARPAYRYAVTLAPMFLVDVAITVWASVEKLLGRAPAWRTGSR